MKVLVTGAAGYIGSALCNKLIFGGHKVIGIDKLLHGGRSIISLVNNQNFKFLYTDIENADEFEEYIDSNTYIVNLAAIVGEPASRKYPEETVKTNVNAVKKLIEIAKRKKVKKFIFVSTCSNYGMVDKEEYADEKFILNPLSLYAGTKVEMEKYLINNIQDTLNWTILRFATVHGLSLRPRFDLTVNDFTLNAYINKKLLIYLPKSNRPYAHVSDIARAIKLVLDNPHKTKCEIFNVGDTSENYRKIDIVEEVKKVVGDIKLEFVEKGQDKRDYKVSFNKIKKELGFSIEKRVIDGVQEIYWAISNGFITDYKNPEYYNV